VREKETRLTAKKSLHKTKKKEKRERENWRLPELAMKQWTIPKKLIGDL
jgi:hypothetical protein